MIKKAIKKISDALAWLGGANLAILGRAPTSRGKFVQMGLVLLTTASIAGVSMTFFMNQEVNEPESHRRHHRGLLGPGHLEPRQVPGGQHGRDPR